MPNFIDFMVDAGSDANEGKYELLKGLAKAQSEGDLEKFFTDNGYTITKEDCAKILEAKKVYNLTVWPPPPAY